MNLPKAPSGAPQARGSEQDAGSISRREVIFSLPCFVGFLPWSVVQLVGFVAWGVGFVGLVSVHFGYGVLSLVPVRLGIVFSSRSFGHSV